MGLSGLPFHGVVGFGGGSGTQRQLIGSRKSRVQAHTRADAGSANKMPATARPRTATTTLRIFHLPTFHVSCHRSTSVPRARVSIDAQPRRAQMNRNETTRARFALASDSIKIFCDVLCYMPLMRSDEDSVRVTLLYELFLQASRREKNSWCVRQHASFDWWMSLSV